jgi:outer membrane translocation and assembly module TamA
VESASGSNVQITGFPVGGNAVFFNNFELRFPLIGENISGVLFEDSGNIYQNLSDVSFRYHQKNVQDFNYMVHAAGFGVRYKTPLGPVRVDLAYALNPPTFLGFKGTYQELLTCNPQLPPDQLPSACQSVRQNTGHFQFFFSIGQTF